MNIIGGVSSGYTIEKKTRIRKADFLSEAVFNEMTYLETLDNMAGTINKINDIAMEGEPTGTLQKYVKRLFPTFIVLCGINPEDLKEEPPEDKVEVAPEPEPVPEEPEQLPDNFIKEENGWGLCPVCRRKMIKLTASTTLADFPAYCKACRAEYFVSWWNVEGKDMEYKRYVNTRSYISRKDIRSEGMKGTGVQGFLRTRTSATERVAMHL